MKFSGLNTKLLTRLTRRCSKYHPGCARRSEQPLEVANHRRNDPFWQPTRLSVLRFPVSGQRAAGKLFFATARAFLPPTYQNNRSVLWLGWKVFLIKLTQPRGGAVVDSAVLFLQVSSSNPCYGKLFLQHFMTDSRKQAVSRSLLRKVLPAKHQQNGSAKHQQN